jgi:type III secretion protein W
MDGINFDPKVRAAVSNFQQMNQDVGAPPTGRLNGQMIVVHKDSAFSVNNAAEEMSFGRSESVEKEKPLDERQVKAFDVRIPSMAELEEIFKTMQEDDAARALKQLAKNLVQVARNQGNPLQAASERFSDPTKQYAVLAAAIHEATQDPGARLELEVLRDALATLEGQKNREIRAGLNTLNAAAEYGPRAEDGDTFRAAYRDAVFGEGTLAESFKALLDRFGDQSFESGAALLLKALAADLGAMRPSLEPIRLNAILQDVYQLQAAGTVLARCRALCERLAREFLLRLKPIDLTKELVKLTTELPPTEWTFSDMVRRYKITRKPKKNEDDESEEEEDDKELKENKLVAFLGGIMTALRAMPPKLFPTDDHRLNAIDAVQESLDKILLEDSE